MHSSFDRLYNFTLQLDLLDCQWEVYNPWLDRHIQNSSQKQMIPHPSLAFIVHHK